MRHSKDRIHRRANLMAHVGQKLRLRFGRIDSRFLSSYKFGFELLEFGNVLRHSVHIGRLSLPIPYDLPESMHPGNSSIYRPLVGKDRVVDTRLSFDCSAEQIPRCFGGNRITLFGMCKEIIQSVSTILIWDVTK